MVEKNGSTSANGVQHKHCPTCGLTKPGSEFSLSKRSKDGFYWECKSCKRNRDRADYARHKEQRLGRAREWKVENPDKVKEARKRYKDRRRELERLSREENRRKRIEEQGLKPWEPHPKDEDGGLKIAIANLLKD